MYCPWAYFKYGVQVWEPDGALVPVANRLYVTIRNLHNHQESILSFIIFQICPKIIGLCYTGSNIHIHAIYTRYTYIQINIFKAIHTFSFASIHLNCHCKGINMSICAYSKFLTKVSGPRQNRVRGEKTSNWFTSSGANFRHSFAR